MSETKPLLIVFAGPNGPGKSTVTDAIRRYTEDFPSLYINADDIERSLGIGTLEAAVEADRQWKDCIARRQIFAMETVMSKPFFILKTQKVVKSKASLLAKQRDDVQETRNSNQLLSE